MERSKPRIVVIAGPTASGKTAIGLELAERFHCEIISADSMQIYRHMNIGTAKPTASELARIPHHMIDIRDPDEAFSAGDFVHGGRESVQGILSKGLIPLVIGGTGMYIRLLLGGIAHAPPSDSALRERLRREEADHGPGTLFNRLLRVDPVSAEIVAARNVARITRALEVFEITGRPMSEFQADHAFGDRPYKPLFICLALDRELLYERIDERVDNMIRAGLVEEISQLVRRGWCLSLRSMQSLGYRHMGMVLAGVTDMDEAVRLMKRDTRRYAKRQLTWFRSEPGVVWRDPRSLQGITCLVSDFLGQ